MVATMNQPKIWPKLGPRLSEKQFDMGVTFLRKNPKALPRRKLHHVVNDGTDVAGVEQSDATMSTDQKKEWEKLAAALNSEGPVVKTWPEWIRWWCGKVDAAQHKAHIFKTSKVTVTPLNRYEKALIQVAGGRGRPNYPGVKRSSFPATAEATQKRLVVHRVIMPKPILPPTILPATTLPAAILPATSMPSTSLATDLKPQINLSQTPVVAPRNFSRTSLSRSKARVVLLASKPGVTRISIDTGVTALVAPVENVNTDSPDLVLSVSPVTSPRSVESFHIPDDDFNYDVDSNTAEKTNGNDGLLENGSRSVTGNISTTNADCHSHCSAAMLQMVEVQRETVKAMEKMTEAVRNQNELIGSAVNMMSRIENHLEIYRIVNIPNPTS